MGSRAELLETLRRAAKPLRDVEERKMFGCEALFTRGSIFALVWKTGRIGVKLPDESRFGALASQKGAEPWRAGPMVMAHWLLVPPALEDAKKLAPWLVEAHAMAAAGLGKLTVPKKIRGVKKRGNGKRETTMAAKKKGNESAIASAGEALANTPQAARTVAEEVVRAVTKVAKAAAGAAKAVAKKAGKAVKKKAAPKAKKAAPKAKKAAPKAKKAAPKKTAKKTAKKK